MPLPSAIKLFIDPRTGDAFGNFAGTTSLTNPVFTLGDTATVELYLVESTGLSTYPRQEIGFPTSPGIRVAVGAIDESPLAGTWTLSYGGNTTTALAYNATPAVVEAALNLLASITAAGGVTVSKIGDNYNIVFNAVGARTELTTNGAALIPLSAANVASLQTGDANKPAIYLVHLQRTVAGLATSFSPTAASAITVESLTAWDGTKATYRVSISPDPKGGSFSLAFDAQTGTDVSSAAISVGASGLDVQNALSVGALADGKVSVTQVGAYAYDITVKTQPATAGLTADAAGLLSFAGYKGELNLNTAEAISLLDGAESVQTTLEVEITSDSKTLTVLQVQCTLQNAVIDAGAVQPLVLDTYLSQTTADGRYFKLSQNLADGTAGTMRTNLGVYSTSQVDTALALKADVSALAAKADLSGAAFTGDLTIAGRAAIGGGLANNAAHKLAIYNGNIVFSAGYGLAFGDGTVQTTAFTGTAATSWGTITGTLTNQLDLSQALSGKANLTGATFTGQLNVGSMATNAPRTEIQTSTIGATVSLTKGGSQQAVISIGEAFDNKPFVFISGTSGTASIHSGRFFSGGLFDGVEPYARKDGATFTGKANFTSVAGAAGINVGIGGTSAAATTAGDLWIATGGASLNFRDGTGAWRVLAATSNTNTFSSPQIIDTTATTPGLRITQKGAGSAIVVEDSTTPDSDALIVDANGNLGIGVSNNPGSVWTGSTYKLEVQGSAIVQGTLRVPYQIDVGTVNDASMIVQSSINFPNYGGTLAGFTTQTNGINTSGNVSFSDYPLEIVLKLNGNLYAVAARQIV
jgi:hypothetical protein